MLACGHHNTDPTDEQYIEAARENYAVDGEIEIDEDAVISRGDDCGAYVQAWVWVPHSDAHADEV